jgi:hypothetical protein
MSIEKHDSRGGRFLPLVFSIEERALTEVASPIFGEAGYFYSLKLGLFRPHCYISIVHILFPQPLDLY